MQTFTVPEAQNNERIDTALPTLMEDYSRTAVQKLIREQLIRLNDKIAKKGNRIKAGDVITVTKPELKTSRFEKKDIPLEIIHEDADLLVVNKPAGLITHPSAHEDEHTLVNALLHHCGDRLSGIGGELRPGIVHRLDKDTSGLLLIAKHDESHRDLAKQIQNRQVEKYYLTLVNGIMTSQEGTIEAPLLKTNIRGKNRVIVSAGKDSKPATTHFQVEKTFTWDFGRDTQEKFSLLKVQIITGRMHQIRVHLSSIGHPVIGDIMYGIKKVNEQFQQLGLTRQFLHAYRLRFKHPRSNEWEEYQSPLPPELKKILEELEKKGREE